VDRQPVRPADPDLDRVVDNSVSRGRLLCDDADGTLQDGGARGPFERQVRLGGDVPAGCRRSGNWRADS
jgi:hypothetical protein